MTCISLNDVLIKLLSGDYPLHQMTFFRSVIGLVVSVALIQMEGGFSILKTKTPLLHTVRGLLIVASNLTYFTAVSVLSLATATALFFVAPLMITLLSIPILGEKVGPLRFGAIIFGFFGVLIMLQPWAGADAREASIWILCLPIFAALTYAGNQVLTRKLGADTKASAMAVYIQVMFILVSGIVYLFAGDGKYVHLVEEPSLIFLLRAWVWPEGTDFWLFLVLGANSAIVGYGISQAYRLASAATVAPFEYIGLPLAIFWGWLIWNTLPTPAIWIGIAMIVGAGLFVFLRERQKSIAARVRVET